MKRPPLGLKPKKIHDEHRLQEVREAMERYYAFNLKIPIEWVIEYNELVTKYYY